MAERRMFAKSIIDSDMFLDMPVTAQLLYFQLGMRADDDGFLNNPKRIMRDVRSSEDDMKVLIAKKYIIPFESGVVVIRHWRIHNYLRSDRYKPTLCEEKNLIVAGENKVYELVDTTGIQSGIPVGIPSGRQVGNPGKVSIDKDSIDKNSIDKSCMKGVSDDTPPSQPKKRTVKKFIPPTLEEVKAYVAEKKLNIDPQKFFDYYEAGEWHDGKGKPVKAWKQKAVSWDRHEAFPKAKVNDQPTQVVDTDIDWSKYDG
jgi:hypothetical protein